uniref:DNA-binding transcriptional regulator n=1 Tax=Siphoviridae sp. ctINK4 TaxID=2825428 RepID=A0A8S5NVF9_9CAUD|nr:MAG TPA: DNA-binding transcriptional regulator [Siphoviridae sp. ctINK4]
MMKANQEIRDRISSLRLKNWEVAKEVGVSDSRFSVWLRTELNDERKKRVLKAIESLS